MRKAAYCLGFLLLTSCGTGTRLPEPTIKVSPTPVEATPTEQSTPQPTSTKAVCPPVASTQIGWKPFEKEGLNILTSKDRINIKALPSGGEETILEFSYEDGSVIDYIQPNSLDDAIEIDKELHFGLQTWACEQETYYWFTPTPMTEAPSSVEGRVCAPSLQIFDVPSKELVEPEWKPLSTREKTFITAAGEVKITFRLEGRKIGYEIKPPIAPDVLILPSKNAFAETMLSYYVVVQNIAWGPISFYLCPNETVYVTGSFLERNVPVLLPLPEVQA